MRLDCAVLNFLLILPDKNCLITSAGRHTRTPATVYPVCGDLIVVLDIDRKRLCQQITLRQNVHCPVYTKLNKVNIAYCSTEIF